MKTSINFLSKLILLISLMGVLLLSNCTSILTAKFESDAIGSDPNKNLPGDPTGDELDYVNGITNQFEVVATPGTPSQKSLEMLNISPSGNNIPGTDLWFSYMGKSTNFTNPMTFTWTGINDFSSNTPFLLVSISDGQSVEAARIRFEGNGDVILIDDLAGTDKTNIGSINDGERYTVLLTVRLADGVFNISILKPSGNINIQNHQLLTSDITVYHNPARPTVSFRFSGGTSANKLTVDEVFIRRGKN